MDVVGAMLQVAEAEALEVLTSCCFSTEVRIAMVRKYVGLTDSYLSVVKGFLPTDKVHIFGYARTKIFDGELRNQLHSYLAPANDASAELLGDVSKFLQLIKYVSGSYDSEDGFRLLDKEISEHESLKSSAEGSSRRLFYLALPPSVYPSVCKMIKTCCMNKWDADSALDRLWQMKKVELDGCTLQFVSLFCTKFFIVCFTFNLKQIFNYVWKLN